MCDFFCSFPCEIRKIVVPLHSLLRTTVQNEAKQSGSHDPRHDSRERKSSLKDFNKQTSSTRSEYIYNNILG